MQGGQRPRIQVVLKIEHLVAEHRQHRLDLGLRIAHGRKHLLIAALGLAQLGLAVAPIAGILVLFGLGRPLAEKIPSHPVHFVYALLHRLCPAFAARQLRRHLVVLALQVTAFKLNHCPELLQRILEHLLCFLLGISGFSNPFNQNIALFLPERLHRAIVQ